MFDAINNLWVGIVKLALWIAYVVMTFHFGAKFINESYSAIGKFAIMILAIGMLIYVTYEVVRY